MMTQVDTTNHHLSSTRVAIHGATGRMGARLCALIGEHPGLSLVAALTRESSASSLAQSPALSHAHLPFTTATQWRTSGGTADVLIDFSNEKAVSSAVQTALSSSRSLLVGTTGLTPETRAQVEHAAQRIAVIIASNTSLGVAACASTLTHLARCLGPAYRVSIVETHHEKKKDAPSGTAIRLADAAAAGGLPVHTSDIFSIRAGDVIGEHTVRLIGPGESIELTHRATTRDLFAHGALRAAAWLARQQPGLYRIEQALGL
jgi:4-hydroxy-tetrahydrodipicolinate reductase